MQKDRKNITKQENKIKNFNFIFNIKSKFLIYTKYILVLIFFSLFLNNQQGLASENSHINKGKWVVLKTEMSQPRNFATANLLPDGNVLIMGSSIQNSNTTDTVDIFDPINNVIIKSLDFDYKHYRDFATATLKNGNILITGGFSDNFKKPNSFKVFNSQTYKFETIDNINYVHWYGRRGHSQIVLDNADVLITSSINCPIIYNIDKNNFYEPKNNIDTGVRQSFYFKYENGDILFFYLGSPILYQIKKNEIIKIKEEIPSGFIAIQLDSENYLNINPKNNYSEGFIYNIKTKNIIPVNNHIDRTWRVNNSYPPQVVLLDNGNVLILGIYAKTIENENSSLIQMRKNQNYDKYSTYLYDRASNMFYEIDSPKFPIFQGVGIVKLTNGDILFVGGTRDMKSNNKIQKYIYK